jgi:hypothetical protein
VTRRDWLETGGVAIVAIAALLGVSRLDSSIYNNYVRLADAFLHGHVWIVWPGPYIDALGVGDKHYIIEGPVPAVLLMPLVALFGRAVNQTAFTCVIAGLAVATGWQIARRLGADRPTASMLAAFFALGTDLAWCAIYGAVWYVAHVVAVFFALLAVAELLGKRRAWLVTLLLVFAAGSRFTLIVAVIPCAAYALWRLPANRRLPAAGAALIVLAVAAGIDVAYNYARWGVPNDIGYVTWYHQDQIGEPTGSPFRLDYLSYELEAFFLAIPAVVDHYPWFVPRLDAVALEVTSPALVLAFFARGGERGFVPAMWIAAILVGAPSFLYYANGGAQFGMRHALDFEPFLFPLIALAMARVPRVASELLLGLSVIAGVWGIWYWRTFYDSYLVHVLPAQYR